MAIFGNKSKDGNLVCNFSHTDGIPTYSKDMAVSIEQNDGESRLEIKQRLSKIPPTFLNYSQITTLDILSEKQITEKSKSVVGRAVVGGILLGPLGGIIGGMSGIGNKNKTNTHFYFIINYVLLNDEEPKVLSFEIVGASLHWDKFVKSLREKLNISNEYIQNL